MEEKKQIKLHSEKYEKNLCIMMFKKYFIDNYEEKELLNFCFSGEVDFFYIRSTIWKMFLGALPMNQNYRDWINYVNKQRVSFNLKLNHYFTMKIFGDPLGIDNKNNQWNYFFNDNELRKLIKLDISRTHQKKPLFQNKEIKGILFKVLFIWSKENLETSYRQGMNEVIAILLIGLYPFYFHSNNRRSILENTNQIMQNSSLLPEELYHYLHDEDELIADLYTLFDSIMKKGILDIYSEKNDSIVKDIDMIHKKKELFEFKYQEEKSLVSEINKKENEIPLQKRCNRIYIDYLRIFDPDLLNYLIHLDINPSLFIVRWLRCLFTREFESKDVLILLDCILANDIQEEFYDVNTPKISLNNLNMLDYLSLALIMIIKDDIIGKEQLDCLQRFFKYPILDSIVDLMKMAFNFKRVILCQSPKSTTRILTNKLRSINSYSTVCKKSRNSSCNRNQTKLSNSENKSLYSQQIKINFDYIKIINENENNLKINLNQIKILNKNENSRKIESFFQCSQTLKILLSKYKEIINSKDYEEFNSILDYLNKK